MANPEDGTPIADSPEAEGQFFENPALKGSGTIRRDGTYGPPQEDPTVARGLGPDKTSGGRFVGDPEARAKFGADAEAEYTDEEKRLAREVSGETAAPAPAPKQTTTTKK